tara:strand:+ start:17524 stop:18558 length:1035 start_codon:yes stop_codon:yes gene_type:complete
MKNLIGTILLAILLAIAYFVFIAEPKEASREDFKDFAIEDTASVDKIFMSQPNGKKLLLARAEDGVWMVNNKFPARKDAVDLILTTLHDIKVSGPVSTETFEHVVKRLASGSTKVEFYKGNEKPEKVWYVGDPTASRYGTYMLLEKDKRKSKNPYITHLLMERGSLNSRFFLDPILWKDRVVLKLNPEKIKSIEVKHFYDTATSFRIKQPQLGQFTIENLKTKEVKQLNNEIAVTYLKRFESIYYEYIDVKTKKEELDSIYTSIPRHEVTILSENGKTYKVQSFNMPVAKEATLEGKPINYHPERMYCFSSELGNETHPIVQNLTFDPLVPPLEQLIYSTNVEK